MAAVYLGESVDASVPEDRRLVALKIIKPAYSVQTDFVEMFMDEAKIASRLSHPNIVRLYSLGAEGARLYIVMELLLGQSLWEVWEACREHKVRLPYEAVAWIGARVASALHHAHELVDEKGEHQELVHRDINPSNLFLTFDGNVKVIDFGLAKARNRVSRTAAGIVKGKLAYMSPEQTSGGSIDRRTDIFALGTTLWELAADRRLFKSDQDADTLANVHRALVPDPTRLIQGFPKELWNVLKRCLTKDPEERYSTAQEVSNALDSYLEGIDSSFGPERLAKMVSSLFPDEQRTQARWVSEASGVVSVKGPATMRPQPPVMSSFPPPKLGPGERSLQQLFLPMIKEVALGPASDSLRTDQTFEPSAAEIEIRVPRESSRAERATEDSERRLRMTPSDVRKNDALLRPNIPKAPRIPTLGEIEVQKLPPVVEEEEESPTVRPAKKTPLALGIAVAIAIAVAAYFVVSPR